MNRLAAWSTADGQLTGLPHSEVGLGAHLEDWLGLRPNRAPSDRGVTWNHLIAILEAPAARSKAS